MLPRESVKALSDFIRKAAQAEREVPRHRGEPAAGVPDRAGLDRRDVRVLHGVLREVLVGEQPPGQAPEEGGVADQLPFVHPLLIVPLGARGDSGFPDARSAIGL